MGYIAHHALIVTSSDAGPIERAHDEAVRILANSHGAIPHDERRAVGLVSPVSRWVVNGGGSMFVVFPDGSNEGWSESDEGDRCRSELIDWLNAQAYDDGGTHYKYVLVRFGEDNDQSPRIEASDFAYETERRAERGGEDD